MSEPSLQVRVRPPAAHGSLDTLDAMAGLACRTRSVVHVVVAREPGVVEHARAAARAVGLDVSVDLLPHTIRVRYAGPAS
jgi:hypothetical protein